MADKKIYFASDMHLGAAIHKDPRLVERAFVAWLERIADDARALILVGDLFDYWFEYKDVVPRGFVRFLGALARLADRGVEIHIFTGNHDVWMFGYFEEEFGATIHQGPHIFHLDGHTFYVAHGDEFDYRSKGFRIVRTVFHSPLCQRLYAAIHPRWTVGFAHAWSKHSRQKSLVKGSPHLAPEYQGEEHEYLVQYAKNYTDEHPNEKIDFFVFGHRHIMLDLALRNNSRIIILGDWISHYSYGVWDGSQFVLDMFDMEAFIKDTNQ